eukprot:gene31941-41435_t
MRKTAKFMMLDRSYNNRDKRKKIYDGDKPENMGLVLDDFRQILEAISIFGDVYNDFQIPVKFEVPASDPWPSSLHGLRLGKRLEHILSSQEFFDKHPEKVKEISRLGFNPSTSSLVDDWDLIIRSMVVFKEIYGNLRIGAKFSVPDEEPWPKAARNIGLKLGVRVAAMRSAGRYVKDHPERKAELDAMGFEWRLRENTHRQQVGAETFQLIVEALKFYKENVDSRMNIQSSFVVPVGEESEETGDVVWPTELQGMKLGSIVQDIREDGKMVFGYADRMQKLNELGFSWEEDNSSKLSKKRFDAIFLALQEYKKAFGDLMVPQQYVVPSNSKFSKSTWELKLGARVHSIRSQGTFVASSPEKRERLTALGFSWDLPSDSKRRRKSLENLYAETTEEDERVISEAAPIVDDSKKEIKPRKKVSPPSEYGDLLGGVSFAQRKKLQVDEEIKQIAVGGPRHRSQPTVGRIPGVLKTAEAIQEYMMDRDFSPDPDIRQKSHFEGYMQSQDLNQALARAISDDDVQAMKTIGYRIMEFGKFNWEDVVLALGIYKSSYGHVDVPLDFVIDESLLEQPEGADFNVDGDIDGFEDPERRSILDGLGFSWGDLTKYQRYRFPPMMHLLSSSTDNVEVYLCGVLALKVYNHLHGFAVPQGDFVVPDSPLWPFWMINMPLGQWSTAIRIQQKMVEEHYPQRKDILTAMGFLWWIPPNDRLVPRSLFQPLTLSSQ